MVKNYLRCYGYLIGLIVLMTVIFSIISYFFNITANWIKVVIPIISLLIASIILGKKVKEKAYIEGIKFSVIYIFTLTILKLILKTEFNYKIIIIDILMIFTSIIGSMIGINIKKK